VPPFAHGSESSHAGAVRSIWRTVAHVFSMSIQASYRFRPSPLAKLTQNPGPNPDEPLQLFMLRMAPGNGILPK